MEERVIVAPLEECWWRSLSVRRMPSNTFDELCQGPFVVRQNCKERLKHSYGITALISFTQYTNLSPLNFAFYYLKTKQDRYWTGFMTAAND